MSTDQDEIEYIIRKFFLTHPETKDKLDYYTKRNLTGTPEEI